MAARLDNTLRSRAFYILKNRYQAEYDEIYNELRRRESRPTSLTAQMKTNERNLLQLLWKYHPEPGSVMKSYQFYGNKLGMSMDKTRRTFLRLLEKELVSVEHGDTLKPGGSYDRHITLLGWL